MSAGLSMRVARSALRLAAAAPPSARSNGGRPDHAAAGAKVQVRPAGRVTTPPVPDRRAVGKTPAILADDMKRAPGEFVRNPIVQVIVKNFSGTFSRQVRIVGATDEPASIPFRANLTLLDAMISVGG